MYSIPGMTNLEHALWLQNFSTHAYEADLIGKVPADFLPPWLENPNYVPQSRATSMYIINSVALFLATFTVFTRIYTRAFLLKNFGWDDWFMLLAMILTWAFSGLQFCFLRYGGVGWHVWDVTPVQIQHCFELIYFYLTGYILVIFVIKLSILFLYQRIIPPKHELQKVVKLFFAFHIIYFIIAELIFGFQCGLTNAGWNITTRLYGQPKCFNLKTLFYVFGIIHVILDAALLFLPIKVVWHLKVPARKKATVGAMFLLGLLACFCPILRMYSLHKMLTGYDMTWTIYEPGMWGTLEITIGVICASIPPSKLFFQRIFSPLFSHPLDSPHRSKKGSRNSRNSVGSFGFDSASGNGPKMDEEGRQAELIDLLSAPIIPPDARGGNTPRNRIATIEELERVTSEERPEYLRTVSNTSTCDTGIYPSYPTPTYVPDQRFNYQADTWRSNATTLHEARVTPNCPIEKARRGSSWTHSTFGDEKSARNVI